MVLSDGIALIDDLTIRLHNCIGLLEEIVIESFLYSNLIVFLSDSFVSNDALSIASK